MKLTFMFSGQGEVPAAETVRMWRTDPDAAAVWARAAAILGEPVDRWLDEGAPTDTRRAQLLATVGALATHAVVDREIGLVPHFIMGHSVGELPALAVAGRLGLASVLELVDARATAMAAAIESGPPTGMLAVMDAPADLAERIGAYQDVYLANLNSGTQVVISGASAALDEFARQEKLRVVKLAVAGAFHTPYMATAARQFREAVRGTAPELSTGPVVIANRTGRPYHTGDVVEELARQLTSPVRWADSVTYAYEHGSQVFLDLSSKRMFGRMSDRPEVRYLGCGSLKAIAGTRHELRHAIAVERGYDLAAYALGAIVTTRNEQPDDQMYRDTVIPCYQELRHLVGAATQSPERVLQLLETALVGKCVDDATRRRKLDSLRWRAARRSVG